jgi:predicted ester cyclase
VKTLQGYADWMQGLMKMMPDGHYDLKCWATDTQRNNVIAYATFIATHTGPGGPPPTGKSTRSDYVYCMTFEGDKIRHMTKIWNAG